MSPKLLANIGLSSALLVSILGCGDGKVAGQPEASDVHINPPYFSSRPNKFDILLVLGNSPGMAPKQKAFAKALPRLLQSVLPIPCIDLTTGKEVPRTDSQSCPAGSSRLYDTLNDVHVGAISSSLGGHGADSCSPQMGSQYHPAQNGMAHFLTRGPDGMPLAAVNSHGFLQADLSLSDSQKEKEFYAALDGIIQGAGEQGCDYQAPLEAWYRFLVDPEPYQSIASVPCAPDDHANSCRLPQGIDTEILEQRHAFLRPDSMLIIVMLSDENDCSLAEGWQHYLALDSTHHLAHGTGACQIDPWSPDCQSCSLVSPTEYPECRTDWPNPDSDDPVSLRCWEQKRRFGIDHLYPIKRYVDGLTQQKFPNGTLNPLFCAEYPRVPDPQDPSRTIEDRTGCLTTLRDTSLVYLMGLVGVPWQDLARNPSDIKEGFFSGTELSWGSSLYESSNIKPPAGVDEHTSLWDVILGKTEFYNAPQHPCEVDPNNPPLDPLMIESRETRSGKNPATGASLVPPTYPPGSPGSNPINGSEHPYGNDLQYACAFDLPEPIDCSGASPERCPCAQNPEKNPLCWNASSKAYETKLFRSPAYPATRQLAVLRGLGYQNLTASICPAQLDPERQNQDDYGYDPAIDMLAKTVWGRSFRPSYCLDSYLSPAAVRTCRVYELTPGQLDAQGNAQCPPCQGARSPISPAESSQLLDSEPARAYRLHCACQINPVPNENGALDACVSELFPQGIEGWCYLDPRNPKANQTLLDACWGFGSRLRFVGQNIPAPDAFTWLQCRSDGLQ